MSDTKILHPDPQLISRSSSQIDHALAGAKLRDISQPHRERAGRIDVLRGVVPVAEIAPQRGVTSVQSSDRWGEGHRRGAFGARHASGGEADLSLRPPAPPTVDRVSRADPR